MNKNEKFDGLKKTGTDPQVEDMISTYCERWNISPLEALKLFPVLARRQWLKRFLAHQEIFLKTLEVPGDIVELGVFYGNSLFTWANLLEIYGIGSRTKRVIGIDSWNGFKNLAPVDCNRIDYVKKEVGAFKPDDGSARIDGAKTIFDFDRFIPWKDRIVIVSSDIEDQCQHFATLFPGVRLSLIHFDCDVYIPTKAGLDYLYPLLSRGGVMIFDEYGIPDWPGETKAVDEFLQLHPELHLKCLHWTNSPAAYCVKV